MSQKPTRGIFESIAMVWIFDSESDNHGTLVEGPRHAEALALLGELTLILDNAAKSGFERIDGEGDKVFDFAYWRDECRRIASL